MGRLLLWIARSQYGYSLHKDPKKSKVRWMEEKLDLYDADYQKLIDKKD